MALTSIEFDIAVVEELLGRRIVKARRIRPWTVARCQLDDGRTPHTVIVKWLRSNPERFRVEREQIGREAAALSVVADVVPDLAPALLAHDLDHDLLVVEDLAPRRTLHSVLSTGLATEGGVAGLHSFAATMGRLHAATTERTVGGPWHQGSRVLIPADDARRLLDDLDGLLPVTDQSRSDVHAALTAIDRPGEFLGFSNGDSGANNCLVRSGGDDARLIDFEHACFRHVLLDAAALHVPGSMWMTVADPVPLGVEDAYRTAAGTGIPAVLDDEAYGFGLAAACAVKALSKLERFTKLDAREPGHHSRRQLVSTLERTVATMRRVDALGSATSWFAALGTTLRARWPDADVDVPDDYTLREPFDPHH